MHLKDTYIIDSPDDPQRVRLVGEVIVNGAGSAPEQLYVDVPRACAPDLSLNGNPWLACLLIVAAHAGEPVRLDKPVDRVLYQNAHELLRVWYNWGGPPVRYIPIEADVYDPPPDPPPDRNMLFYSGGVDSLFSLLSDNRDYYPEREWSIDELLVLWGFDIALDQPETFARARSHVQTIADARGKALIDIRTNIRPFLARVLWGRSHPSVLAMIALALENRWRRVLVAANRDYLGVERWGMNVVVTPLWSTSRLRMIQDGSAFTRQERIAAIAGSPLAQQTLRVCSRDTAHGNCSECPKCLRTMMGLELAGALDSFTVFNPRGYHERFARMQPRYGDLYYLEELRAVAEAQGRRDLARLAQKVLARGIRLRRRERVERFLRDWVMPARPARLIGDALDWGYAHTPWRWRLGR